MFRSLVALSVTTAMLTTAVAQDADEIKSLFTSIAEKSGFAIDVMEVDADHIHVLVDAPPTLSATSIATRLKGQSTFHIWKKFGNFLAYQLRRTVNF